jgi:uncharacterized RDD family membrane protein YckC
MASPTGIAVAGFRRRALALCADVLMASAISLGVVVSLHALGVARRGAVVNNVTAALAVPVYFTPQWAVGRTIGMRLAGLELVRQDSGKRPGLVRAALRLPVWVVDLLLVMVVAVLTGAGDSQKRTPHDLLSRTVVVRVHRRAARAREQAWPQWLAAHHDERSWADRNADFGGRHVTFLVGSNRRVALVLVVALAVYGIPFLLLLLVPTHRKVSAFTLLSPLGSLVGVAGLVLVLRYRLKRPAMTKAPASGRMVLMSRVAAAVCLVAAAATAGAIVRGWWVAAGVASYVALLATVVSWAARRTARVLADPSRLLPPSVAEKVAGFPPMSPVVNSRRVTLVLADGRRVRRVVVAYGGVVFTVGQWRSRLDFDVAEVVDAANQVVAGR